MALPPGKPPKGIAWLYTLRYVALLLVPMALLDMLTVLVARRRSWVLPDRLPDLVGSLLSGTVSAGLGTGFVIHRAYRNLFDVNYDERSSTDKTVRLTIRLPYHAAFDRCLAALLVLGECHLLSADTEQGRIEAVRIPRPYWKVLAGSCGERISIRLGSDRRGRTEIQVTSRAPMTRIIFDTGQNERNVRDISGFLLDSAA